MQAFDVFSKGSSLSCVDTEVSCSAFTIDYSTPNTLGVANPSIEAKRAY